ncbi:MAG: HU family DNA-binding protein [Candidatus Izemoplasmataceae bacterium]
MIKQEIYNVLLKVSLYFFILFLLLFVVDLLFAVTDNAIDCTSGAFCSIKPGFNFYEITLMILGGLIVVFMVLARVFHYLVKRYDDLIDVSAYKEKYQQSQQAFSESELYQSTKIEKEDSIASILLKSSPDDDEDGLEHEKEITIDDLEELPDLEDEVVEEEVSEKIVVEDLMAEEIEVYKKEKEEKRKAEILAKEKELEEARQKELDKLSKDMKSPQKEEEELEISIEDLVEEESIEESIEEDEELTEVYEEDEEISIEHLKEESAIDQLSIKDIKERLYKDAIIVTEEEIKEKLKDQSKADVIEELRADKEREKELEKQEKLRLAREQEEKESVKEEPKEEIKEEPKIVKPKKKAKPKSKKDLIEDIAEASGLSKNKSEQFLNTMIEVITETLNNDDEVDFGAIGKFSYIIMPAKDAVNPQTKEKIVVPEHKEVRFRFDEDFKEDVNQE